MKRASILAFLFLVPISLFAGVIFGTIRIGDRPLREGIEVCVQSKDGPICANTDPYGGFRLEVPETGVVVLEVRLPGRQNPTLRVNSFSTPTRYELELFREGDQWRLRIK